MLCYFRKIRKAKWHSENIHWLAFDDIQADALDDLKTSGNELSVFKIGSEEDLERILVALALGCEYISNIDYVLIRDEDLQKLQVNIKKSQGITPDDTVNSIHFDLCELSAKKILNLADVIRSSEKRRITEPKVKEKAALALIENRIDRTRIKLKSEPLQDLEDFADKLS